MKIINEDNELVIIQGGGKLSGTIINAIVAGAKIILEIGRSFGTAIRRTSDGNICNL